MRHGEPEPGDLEIDVPAHNPFAVPTDDQGREIDLETDLPVVSAAELERFRHTRRRKARFIPFRVRPAR